MKNIHKALKLQGLLVCELGTSGNIAAIENAFAKACNSLVYGYEPKFNFPAVEDFGKRIKKMSRIVVFVGSMRKGGNTDLLAQAFAEGAGKNNTVEIVSVADYKVNPCIGCNSCFTREGNQCFQKDDMAKIYEKLKAADIVVIASPVYFYGISAELKAMIDRLHTPMRNEFRVKKLALLLVGAATLPELFDAIKLQYQLVLNFFQLEDAGMVLVRGVKDIGDIKGTKALEEAYNLGYSIR